jgi:hypothetical protein
MLLHMCAFISLIYWPLETLYILNIPEGIEVDILFPDNLFAAGNCDFLLHIFVSKQFRTKPERYTSFVVDDKCESLDFNASSMLLVQRSISRVYFVVNVYVVISRNLKVAMLAWIIFSTKFSHVFCKLHIAWNVHFLLLAGRLLTALVCGYWSGRN